ncbi:Pur regulon 18 kDa protein [Piscirickettsia salmonis]|uniref:CvpA family protein n=1 Tax=Piscirickettsia salmonis TaxID=1238 RepID=UPI0012B944DC|nr:CvpA family protein [Piscirickettsia salmonis]QGP50677.1 Pur regulon 18 kDa protein [Piscirickettsia salmonis]QGP54130.1 Pur regulon 18 kDa protein [Piscirickettsia salmonis]QGP63707.1 Pur regulon 18 kDa protein [Piscirickettsia salmonis]
MSLNWVDIVLLAIVGISTVLSLARGFVRELLSLLVWAGAFLGAMRYAPQFADRFHYFSKLPSVQYAISYICIFLAILLLGMLIAAILVRLVQKSELDLTDRLLGVIFGAARGLLLVMLIVFAVNATDFAKQSDWLGARLVPYLTQTVQWTRAHIPKELLSLSESEPKEDDASAVKN